jgi:hypothetical protein
MSQTYLRPDRYDWGKAKEEIAKYLRVSVDSPEVLQEYRESVRTGYLPSPIFDKLDCEYGKDKFVNDKYIEELHSLQLLATKLARRYNKPIPRPFFDDNMKRQIQEDVKSVSPPLKPTNRRPKFIIVFNRLMASNKAVQSFFGGSKYNPIVTTLQNRGVIPEQFLYINNYDIVEKYYFQRNKYNQTGLLNFTKNFYGHKPPVNWSEYEQFDKRYGGPLTHHDKNYSNLIKTSYYYRGLFLNRFLDQEPGHDIVYEYTHRNPYNLTCLLENYENLKDYDVEMYFPSLDEALYKHWMIHLLKMGVYQRAGLINAYPQLINRNLLYAMLLQKIEYGPPLETDKSYCTPPRLPPGVKPPVTTNIDLKVKLLDMTQNGIIVDVNPHECSSIGQKFGKNIAAITNFYCETSSIRKRYESCMLEYDYNKSPDENIQLQNLGSLTLNIPGEYAGPISKNEIFQKLYSRYQKTEKKEFSSALDYVTYHENVFKTQHPKKVSINPTVGVLYGPPGSGKSRHIGTLKKQLPDAVFIRKDEVAINSRPYLIEMMNLWNDIYQHQDDLVAVLGEKSAKILLNTLFLDIEGALYGKYYGLISKFYFNKLVEHYKGQDLIIEVTGRFPSHINNLFDKGYTADLLRDYKKEIHAIHVRFYDQYWNVMYRSLDEFRYIPRNKLLQFSNDSFKNLNNLLQTTDYNIKIYDNTDITRSDSPLVLMLDRPSGTTPSCPIIGKKYVDVEHAINDLMRMQCNGIAGGGVISFNTVLIAVCILLIILFCYFIYHTVVTDNLKAFDNSRNGVFLAFNT